MLVFWDWGHYLLCQNRLNIDVQELLDEAVYASFSFKIYNLHYEERELFNLGHLLKLWVSTVFELEQPLTFRLSNLKISQRLVHFLL